MSPRRLIAGFLAVLVAIVAASVLVDRPPATPVLALTSSTGQLEAAKKADAAAVSGVKAAEADLAAARATKAATAEVVAAAEAEAPKEEPKEEPTTTAVVNASPTGPGGSWTAVFADGFGKELGATGDAFWEKKTNAHGCCNNSSPNETSSENPSAVHWSATAGLELRCEGLVCSGVSVPGSKFSYQLGRGASFVFEAVAKLADNTAGGDDPGFWSISTTRWPPEFDFFEYWGWHKPNPLESIGGFPVYHGTSGQRELYFRPTAEYFTGYHRFTVLVQGNTFTEYIDGGNHGSMTVTVNTDAMNLILTHAIREYTTPRNSSFDVRSVAVYEDSSHAGQFVTGGGIAPGTTVH